MLNFVSTPYWRTSNLYNYLKDHVVYNWKTSLYISLKEDDEKNRSKVLTKFSLEIITDVSLCP
jgi:hypothetical protein